MVDTKSKKKQVKKKKRRSILEADIRQDLQKLKKLGLYSGDLRKKKPSKYAKKLVDDFADVLNDRAQVISIPRHATKKSSGKRAADRTARELANEFGEVMRSKNGKVIVKTTSDRERAFYSEKEKTILTRSRFGDDREIVRRYIRLKNGELPELKNNELYSLPFARGRNGVEYLNRAEKEEILKIAFQYGHKASNPYRGAINYIMLGKMVRRRNRK
jgi:hypothetical protein